MPQRNLKRRNANIIQLGESATDGQLRSYFDDLERLTNQALSGRLPEDDFRRRMERLVLPAIAAALSSSGGNLDIPAAQVELLNQQTQARNSINILANDLYSRRYSRRELRDAVPGSPTQTAQEGKDKLGNRLALWVYSMAGIYAVGKTFTPPSIEGGQIIEARLVWRRGPTVDPCDDCLGLDGTVLTTSEWRRTGIRPQSQQLDCEGWRCLCTLVATDAASVGMEGIPI
jgi:hypothetical protein